MEEDNDVIAMINSPSQWSPRNPDLQRHLNFEISFMQVPSFIQGDASQNEASSAKL